MYDNVKPRPIEVLVLALEIVLDMELNERTHQAKIKIEEAIFWLTYDQNEQDDLLKEEFDKKIKDKKDCPILKLQKKE